MLLNDSSDQTQQKIGLIEEAAEQRFFYQLIGGVVGDKHQYDGNQHEQNEYDEQSPYGAEAPAKQCVGLLEHRKFFDEADAGKNRHQYQAHYQINEQKGEYVHDHDPYGLAEVFADCLESLVCKDFTGDVALHKTV